MLIATLETKMQRGGTLARLDIKLGVTECRLLVDKMDIALLADELRYMANQLDEMFKRMEYTDDGF